MPKASLFVASMNLTKGDTEGEAFQSFSKSAVRNALNLWLCCLPGMALCYPLELARLRVMLDFNEPPENVQRKLFTQVQDLVKESPNAWKEAYHGVAPYLAHHTMFGLAMLWPYTLFNPGLMPAMLGYLSTGVLAYPISTLHTRVAYEAG